MRSTPSTKTFRRENWRLPRPLYDVALAQLLTMRLVEHEREAGEFWGLNGDGRAPAGSFGSRIQLALLVGLITPKDAAILRGVKGLRNLFAHRVHIGLLSPEAVTVTTSLHTLWVKTHTAVVETDACSEVSAELNRLRPYLALHEYASAGLLLSIFSAYHAHFHQLHARIAGIPVRSRKRERRNKMSTMKWSNPSIEWTSKRLRFCNHTLAPRTASRDADRSSMTWI